MKKPPRKTKEIDGKLYTIRGVELTRCSHTMTEAQFFSWVLSNARRLTTRWKPRNDALIEKRREYKGPDKRTKWEYQCSLCYNWYKKKDIEADHIIPCGGINGWEKIEGWYRRAFVEKEGFRVLCKECHNTITHGD